MTAQFRYASLTSAKPLIGLYAESGRGKTYSALLLARGFAGPDGKIAMIETERGRGEAYVDMIEGGYDVCPLHAPFSPKAYGEAIKAAETAGYDALIIDSASHEWEGEGGVLSMASDNQAGGKKGVLVWQQPKIAHQREFVGKLMQTPISLVIVCMRAKYPMKEGRDANGKKGWIRSEVLEPKQSEDFLYEMFVHGWIDEEHRFHGTKYTRPDLREIIRDGEQISIETGERLARWSHGSEKYGITEAAHESAEPEPFDAKRAAEEMIAEDIENIMAEARNIAGFGTERFREWFKALPEGERMVVRPHIDELKAIAEEKDQSYE
jgi:hypothetical protein